MRRSFKRVVFVLVGMGIVLGVTLACGSTESETPDSTDAAAAEDTATDQDSTSSASAAPEPAAAKDTTTAQGPDAGAEPAGKVESLLSGETLARYRALPEEYRVALEAYSRFGVSDDLIPTVMAEKMAQWPDSPEPIQDLLDADRYAKFQEITAIDPMIGDTGKIHRHASFFLGYYPYVLQTEDTVEGRKQAFANLLDAMANKYSPGGIPEVPEPRLDDVIVPSAVSVLDELGPRLREALTNRRSDEMVDVQSLAIELKLIEFMLLKSKPGLEVPTLAEQLSEDNQGLFNDLPADMREDAEGRFARGVLFRMTGLATSADHSTTSLPSDEALAEIAHREFKFAQTLAKQQE